MESDKRKAAARIHIVGSPGSGKTTLARRIAAITESYAYDLDEIAYEEGAGPERRVAERLHDVHRIASGPQWVTEGAYLGWTDELFASADLIVWLDLPWRVCARRIVLRHVKASICRANRHPGLLNLFRFLRWTLAYHKSRSSRLGAQEAGGRAATTECVAQFSSKLVWCRSQRDADALLVANELSAIGPTWSGHATQ
jgi:GTPase SAR1 family protein